MHNGCSKRESSRIKRVNLLGFSLLKYEQIAYCTFHHFKRWLLGSGKYSFCCHRKQTVENTKQPVVLPLTPLNEAVIIAYEWLNMFMLFKGSCWLNMQYVQNLVIRVYVCFFLGSSVLFMSGYHIGVHGVNGIFIEETSRIKSLIWSCWWLMTVESSIHVVFNENNHAEQ